MPKRVYSIREVLTLINDMKNEENLKELTYDGKNRIRIITQGVKKGILNAKNARVENVEGL